MVNIMKLVAAAMLIFTTLFGNGLKMMRPTRAWKVRHSTRLTSTKASWFGEGLKFSCTQCGACCSGSPGSVRISKEEIAGMSAHLKLGEADFKEKYLRVETQDEDFSWYELKEVPTPPEEERDGVVMQAGLDCVFLDRDTIKGKAICSMYDVRPLQCRTWPFWEELVDEEESWVDASKGPEGCPGLGKGKFYSADEIERSVQETEQYRHELDHEAMDGINN